MAKYPIINGKVSKDTWRSKQASYFARHLAVRSVKKDGLDSCVPSFGKYLPRRMGEKATFEAIKQ